MDSKLIGISENEVKLKIKQYGLNKLPEKPRPSFLYFVIKQLKSPLVYVLIFALFLTIIIGNYKDSFVIFIAIFINTLLGVFQEKKASDSLFALRKYVNEKVVVIRDGVRKEIDSLFLVPGDIVFLRQGDKVAADGVIIQANRLFLDESVITGESIPVAKDEKDEVFMGSIVVSGVCFMKVVLTGKNTVIGKIAFQIQEKEEETPFQIQLKLFSRQLLLVILFLLIFIFLVGIVKGLGLFEILVVSIALAVSSIPEGLLISLTVILAIGMRRILKRKGLVKSLLAAETLGGVTTLCIDKTGTLTEGKMKVVGVFGDKVKLAKQVLVANDLDDPIVIASYDWASGFLKNFEKDKFERLDSIPFSPKDRYFASLNRWGKDFNRLFVNGAPDIIIDWCNISKKEKKRYLSLIDELTENGNRLIGFAFKDVPLEKDKILDGEVKRDLNWVGVISLYDPVRKGVADALEKTRRAGIRLIVITGDYPKTAEFVLRQIGFNLGKEEILLGSDVESMSLKELSEVVGKVKLFARTKPDQKLKIVEALKQNGEVVAMMGDGVNDASALHRADIGIAVGEATDVAKESSDLVLLDSNFSTILAAIEEGRGIFENIKKVVIYLLSDSFAEILVVLFCIVLGLPLALLPIHILWINLVSDGFPGIAIAVDPKRKGIMNERPRLPSEKIVERWMILLIASVSFFAGLIAFIFFLFTYKSTGNLVLARSVAFLTLGLNSLIYVFSVKGLMTPFWKYDFLNNRWLLLAVFAGFLLQVLPFISEFTRDLFNITAVGINYWILAVMASFMVFLFIEFFKLALNFKKNFIYTS